MEKIQLSVQMRSSSGKGVARKMRASGKVPAVYYGSDSGKCILLSINSLDYKRVRSRAQGNAIFELRAESGQSELAGKMALLKEEQLHPVSGKPIHLDFYELHEGKHIRLRVPVVFTGKAKGTTEGGIVQYVRRELDVRCLPNNIPSNIEIDISDLDIGDSLHVREVKFPQGVLASHGTDGFTVVAVIAPDEEEKAAVATDEASAPVVEPARVGEKSEPTA